MTTTTRLYALTPIHLDCLTALDLRVEAAAPGETTPDPEHPGLAAYRALAARPDGTPEAMALEVLHVAHAGRIGIAWGAEAQWADIGTDETVETLVALYLDNGPAYEARS